MPTKVLTGLRVPFDVSRLPNVEGQATDGVTALLLWGGDLSDMDDAFAQVKGLASRDGAAILVQYTDNRVVDWVRMPELVQNRVLVATIPATAADFLGEEELRRAVESSLALYVAAAQPLPDVRPAPKADMAQAAERRALRPPLDEASADEFVREYRDSLSDDNIR